jgi:hypothetical protein
VILSILALAVTAPAVLEPTRWAQLSIQQTVVIRVPSAPPPRVPDVAIRWKEQKGPKCVSVANLGGFAITKPDSIDLIVKGGARYRARLQEDCPSVAFYSGFYVRPPADGRLCVGRDKVHSRAGGQCAIEKFRTLVPTR